MTFKFWWFSNLLVTVNNHYSIVTKFLIQYGHCSIVYIYIIEQHILKGWLWAGMKIIRNMCSGEMKLERDRGNFSLKNDFINLVLFSNAIITYVLHYLLKI